MKSHVCAAVALALCVAVPASFGQAGKATATKGGGKAAEGQAADQSDGGKCIRFQLVPRGDLGIAESSVPTMLLDSSSGDTWVIRGTGWEKLKRTGGPVFTNVRCGRFSIVSEKEAKVRKDNLRAMLWVPDAGLFWFLNQSNDEWVWVERK